MPNSILDAGLGFADAAESAQRGSVTCRQMFADRCQQISSPGEVQRSYRLWDEPRLQCGLRTQRGKFALQPRRRKLKDVLLSFEIFQFVSAEFDERRFRRRILAYHARGDAR